MSLAACSGDDEHHGTTLVIPPTAPTEWQDAGAPQRAEICEIDAAYLSEHKACVLDSDCAALEYRPTCCANRLLVGVNTQSLPEVSACADKSVKRCACEATPNRAEDGRAISSGVTSEVRCDAGMCQTRVTGRTCGGKLSCKAGELCVSYGDAQSGAPDDAGTSDNAYVAFACLPSPCADTLDCSCAQAACDARGVRQRKCEIARTDDADVACVPYRD